SRPLRRPRRRRRQLRWPRRRRRPSPRRRQKRRPTSSRRRHRNPRRSRHRIRRRHLRPRPRPKANRHPAAATGQQNGAVREEPALEPIVTTPDYLTAAEGAALLRDPRFWMGFINLAVMPLARVLDSDLIAAVIRLEEED